MKPWLSRFVCRAMPQHWPPRDARTKYKKFVRRQKRHLLAVKGKKGVRRIRLGAVKGRGHG